MNTDDAILRWLQFSTATAIYWVMSLGLALAVIALLKLDVSAFRLGTVIWLVRVYFAFRVEFRNQKE